MSFKPLARAVFHLSECREPLFEHRASGRGARTYLVPELVLPEGVAAVLVRLQESPGHDTVRRCGIDIVDLLAAGRCGQIRPQTSLDCHQQSLLQVKVQHDGDDDDFARFRC